jgi:serine/threonine protein kinase
LAQDEDRLNTHCVIKQFSPQVQGTKSMEKAIKLFNQEAVRLAELGQHSQIPDLLAYFEHDGLLYLVQQFVEGQSLLQEMREQGAFDERQIRDVLADTLPVLRFIHKHQVIHRDITPTNILRRKADDRLLLIDFGVAKQINEEAGADQPGTRIGTEGYAPIEQFRSGKAYPASDLYSLGATCLHLMTETRPDNLYDPLNGRWIWRDYLRTKKNKAVSEQLAYILDTLLRDLVNDRYQSADEVMRDLNADSFFPSSRTPTAKSASPPGNPAVRPGISPLPAAQPIASSPAVSKPPVSQPPSRPPTSGTPISKTPVSGSPAPRSTGARLPGSRCIQTLTGHNSWVTSLDISQATSTFASSSLDDTVKIWNLNTGEELLTLTGHTRGVNTVAISPNGRFVVSGSDDYTVKIWNFLNGALLKTLSGHSRDVTAVDISSDGRILATGCEDRTVRLWDLNTGSLLKALPGVAGMIKSVAISPDDKFLASGGLDNKVKLWNLRTTEQLQTLVGHLNQVHAIAFSPRGQVLASASKDKTIRVWNLQNGELLRTLADHTRDVNAVAITPDGKTLISGSSDTTIKLWDLTSGKVMDTWREHVDAVNAIAISTDGKLLISGSSDKTIKLWQLH